MEEYGITPEAIAESIQRDFDERPIYRDARGNEWNGRGNMPDWLRAAKNAGVNPDFFLIETTRESTAASPDGKRDRRQLDLFA